MIAVTRSINKQPITAHLTVNNSQSEYAEVIEYSSNQETRPDLYPRFMIGAISLKARGFLSPLLSLSLLLSLHGEQNPLGPENYFHTYIKGFY